ncbi:MAG: hypothetical protein UX16_C0004G0009 [Parcubacteria group bacterium GW2011_GWB1_45_7]|uniref:Uncharacterized protein n=2 Tax=Candidatus Colwelliibacteriota TaxID=1817904 RepID=A0A1G1ZBU9_9BACT|nr:MAG: hypothetical protein UX16_C0004G0009 [Parcubacteria group bacterium GW2011_GWB1_45_7]OGY57384.1 MAG: hypothetical protein A3C03_00690 [Candidatus Colwellbacteria bacterium RIFCSPHIGHO2_02_FULL_45_17]OGY60544.1 MAG: hypothetical protein A3I33_02045 [Candidatus Colwellbacteria bacterium RIFCSPLOWO2_02_FULL_45_11]OGY62128.1 MAG: hypothetical protein A3G58_02485 [Candidatus Colwellbacteria bacterium RIFCSPLOWO2_12_FULL_46_17]
MAITVEQGNGKKGLVGLVVGVSVVVGLIIATYVLFFTKPPQIEVLVPSEVKTISKISEVDLDPSKITGSPQYKALQEHVLPPVLGEFGRENPFARF